MELVLGIAVGLLLIVLGVINNYMGIKCPVCGSTRHWTIGYFGNNKDKNKTYCSNCYRALQNPISKSITIFDDPQEFHKKE